MLCCAMYRFNRVKILFFLACCALLLYTGGSLRGLSYQTPTSRLGDSTPSSRYTPEQLAYVFYATDPQYACSALVNIHRLLAVFKTPHPIYVLTPVDPPLPSAHLALFQHYNVTVIQAEPPPLANGSSPYYTNVLLKLKAFELQRWAPAVVRAIVLDADQLIMRPLDHLFATVPVGVQVAAPHAYWLQGEPAVTTALMLITLSESLWARVNDSLGAITADQYDMDLVNQVFRHEMVFLGGSYCTLNSHWEVREVPAWSDRSTDAAKRIAWPLTRRRCLVESERGSWVTEPPQPDDVEQGGSTTASPRRDVPSLAVPSPSSWSLLSEASAPENQPMEQESISRSKPHPTVSASTGSRGPVFDPLTGIFFQAHVLHFTAIGKPWSYSVAHIYSSRPSAHPLLAQQFLTWRTAARALCPEAGWSGIGYSEI